MKYYDFDIDCKLSYINRYKIVGDSIVIYYASSEKEFIPYSIENERNILHQMEEQARNIDKDKYSDYIKDKIKYDRIRYLLVFLVGGALIVNLGIFDAGFVEYLISLGVSTASGVLVSNIHTKKLRTLLSDFGKNKTFIDSKELLKTATIEGVSKKQILENTSKKGLNELKKYDYKLNINTINNLPYKDVVNMLGNTYREVEYTRKRRL